MIRNTRVNNTRGRTNPSVKETRKPATLASNEAFVDALSINRVYNPEDIAKTGVGVSSKPVYHGEVLLRDVVAEKSEKRTARKVELLRANGHVKEAENVEARVDGKKAKYLNTKRERKETLSARRAANQLQDIEIHNSRYVAQTYGQEEGEFRTLADKEAAKQAQELHEKRSAAAKKSAAKAAETRRLNRQYNDLAYEDWYNEEAQKDRAAHDKEWTDWYNSKNGKEGK